MTAAVVHTRRRFIGLSMRLLWKKSGRRVATRHGEPVDAAVVRAFGADDLIELGRVEVNRGWCSCGRSGHRCLADGQGCTKRSGHLHRITMPANMHIEGHRFGAQQMIM